MAADSALAETLSELTGSWQPSRAFRRRAGVAARLGARCGACARRISVELQNAGATDPRAHLTSNPHRRDRAPVANAARSTPSLPRSELTWNSAGDGAGLFGCPAGAHALPVSRPARIRHFVDSFDRVRDCD